MATYTNAAGSATNVRPIWSDAVDREVLSKTLFGKLAGTGMNSAIQIRDELQKGPGDQARFTLIGLPTSGTGLQDTGSLEGNEQTFTPYTDTVTINTLRNAFRSEVQISQQRSIYDIREELKHQGTEWGADTFDYSWIWQAAGYLPGDDTNTILTGNNAIATLDSDHYINAETPAPGGASNDQDLDAGDIFTLPLLDEALRRAKVLSPSLRPVRIDGGEYYIAVLAAAPLSVN